MKIAHWSMTNQSGMHAVASACAEAERRLGHSADVVNIDAPQFWGAADEADVHVVHTHFPDEMRSRRRPGSKLVYVGHGTPEHIVDNSITAYEQPGYGPADGYMMLRDWLREADAVVTFWERHAWIYRQMMGAKAVVDVIPMGVDVAFWRAAVSPGKYAGSPSVWTCENQHRMKWVLDLVLAWPDVRRAIPRARLHAHYIPTPQHRVIIDLANSNGAAYTSYLSAARWEHADLRNLITSVDFFANLVRYGDHNCLTMQAAAVGTPVISYRGNPYASYWVTEGDQRVMAAELIQILAGVVPARIPEPVPALEDMGAAMVAVYERILDRAPASVPGSLHLVTEAA